MKNNLSPSFVHSIFPRSDNTYNLRNNPLFRTENIRTTHYGSETLIYRGPKTWELVPNDIKESSSLHVFKRRIIYGNLRGACAGCVKYMLHLGFI